MTLIRAPVYTQMPQKKSRFHCAMLYKHRESTLAPTCLRILSTQKQMLVTLVFLEELLPGWLIAVLRPLK